MSSERFFEGDRIIFHADLNSFYASVAILLNEELRGKGVVICGDVEKRHGIVLAKSDPAKRAGIKTGDPVWMAKQKFGDDLVVVPPDFKKYSRFSKQVFNIYTTYTPNVESFGMDECWLDVTGCPGSDDPEKMANEIRERVKIETGLTVSIGVSFSKIFAKLGSDMKKPDAVTVIGRDNYKHLAWNLPVSDLLYIGKSSAKALEKAGIHTIGDLANTDLTFLTSSFGKIGVKMHNAACGNDGETVKLYCDGYLPESVGNGMTSDHDICNIAAAESLVFSLCEVIAYRLRGYHLKANSVSVNFRDSRLSSFSRQVTLDSATDSATVIASTAMELIRKNYDFKNDLPLRTITVGTAQLLSSDEFMQDNFLMEDNKKAENIDKSLDIIRAKYGYESVKRANTLGTIFVADAKEVEEGYVPFDRSNKH